MGETDIKEEHSGGEIPKLVPETEQVSISLIMSLVLLLLLLLLFF
jgi:hypothetical protein